MVDRALKQTSVKGASAAEMAARPFQCQWHEGCAKSFNRKSDLQRHYRIHTNERPYACDYKPCSKTFIQRSALTVHRRTHTGDKPHKCPFLGCGKCFSDSSSLARHRRIHTNDKPYICRNQRCRKAFCRKTTMTKHIRKEHPADSLNDDRDAEYSDIEPTDDEGLEDDSDGIKEEPQSHYEESLESRKAHISRGPSQYNRNLWGLPGQTAPRPSPLDLQRATIPRSDAFIQEIKLERSSSTTPQRSMTDPYPDGHLSNYSMSRADTMPDSISIPTSIPRSHANGAMAQQYQLRSHDNGLWSPQHAMQDSPTSLTHSSPSSASTQSHPLLTSQPFQYQSVEVSGQDHMQYSNHDGLITSAIQQPMSDMTVHEIHLDGPQQQPYRDMAPTPVHQRPYDGGIQQISQQDSYIAMSRDVSHQYEEPAPRSGVHPYQDEMPPTPAPTQQLPHYTTSLPEAPYQQPQYIQLDSFSMSNQVYPPNNALYQYNDAGSDWLKDTKLEQDGWILPAQRVQDFNNWGA